MASERMKLMDTKGNVVWFSPSGTYSATKENNINDYTALNGRAIQYEWFSVLLWKIGMNMVLAATATQIQTWWMNRTVLTYYPDVIDHPDQSYSVMVDGKDMPLPDHETQVAWNTRRKGTLALRQVVA